MITADKALDAQRYRFLVKKIQFGLDSYKSCEVPLGIDEARWSLKTGPLFTTKDGRPPESLDDAIDKEIFVEASKGL